MLCENTYVLASCYVSYLLISLVMNDYINNK